MNWFGHQASDTSRAPRPSPAPSQPSSASWSRIASARSKSFAARASSRSAISSALGVGLSTLDPARVRELEADQLKHLRQDGNSRAAGTSPRFASPTSSNTSARARGVLKSSARASRKLSSRSARGVRGRLDGASPLLRRRDLPRLPAPPMLPEEVPQPLDLSHRLLHLLRPESQRLPVVPRDQVEQPPPRARTDPAPRTAERCCPPISTSSRPRSRSSRCASRPARTGRPAASDWAISFSWWGKTRSEPPPWIAKEAPSSCSAITEHSMCQAGPARAPGRVPAACPRPACAPSRGRSRAGPP